MCQLNLIYTPNELRALDAKKRKILKKRAVHHVKTSPEIRSIIKKDPKVHKKLRAKLRPLFNQLTK